MKTRLKKIAAKIKKHRKPIIVLCCALLVGTAVYTDFFSLGKETPVTDYIYNTDSSKILGEATLVDNITSDTLQEIESVSESSYFANAGINREKSRNEALETLQVVVDSAEEMPEVKDKALCEIMQIASDIESRRPSGLRKTR